MRHKRAGASGKIRMARRTFMTAAPALLALGANGAQAQAPTMPTAVRVGVLNSLSEIVIFIAMEKGYFKEEGLDIKLERFSNTADMVAPLSSGQIDVASGAPTLGLFNGALRGLPLKLVADKGRNSKGHGFNAIVIRKDLIESGKVKSAADLKGRKIATASLHSPMEQQLEIALKKAGLSNKDVEIQNLGFPDMITALDNKAIDGALMIEPFVAIAAKRGVGVRFMGVDDIAPDFQIAGVIYGPDFVAKHPDAAKRWMVAYVRAIRDYLAEVGSKAGKDEVIAVLKKYASSTGDATVLENAVFPGFDPDGYLNLKTIEESIDWYAARGLLKAKPKLSDVADYQYLNYALERLGRREPPQKIQ